MHPILKVINSRLLKKTSLFNVCYFVTYRCNARCSFCDLGNKALEKPELTTAQSKQLIDDLASMDVRSISLVGGEPTTREDLHHIISHIRAHGIKALVVTNGLKIRQDLVDARPDFISVSLDFADASHDRYRNVKGAYKKAIRALAFYSSQKRTFGHGLGVNIILLKENMYRLRDIIEIARGGGADSVSIQPPVRAQFRDEADGPLEFDDADIGEVERILDDLKREYGEYISQSRMFLQNIPHYLGGRAGHEMFCFAGGTFLNVDPCGDVVPCLYMPPVGNVVQDRLRDIVGKASFRQVHQRIIRGQCPGCYCPDILEPNLLFHPRHWPELLRKARRKL